MDDEVRAFVRRATGASAVEHAGRVQSLWGGYGEIVRVQLLGASSATAILKVINPPTRIDDARSHARKKRSYEVERAFYARHSARTDEACRVPALLGEALIGARTLLLLEDLDGAGFSVRRGPLAPCVDWLAAFHARFLGHEPEGLFRVGTYWHLATRPDELARMRDRALREAAPELDRKLSAAHFQTFVHGDAKVANFCFSRDGERVAAVDFQYVGGGAGIKDVAYLLHQEQDERALVDRYFERLREVLPSTFDGAALEKEWRALYPVAREDFERFLSGWMR